jgi:hypothetical protein
VRWRTAERSADHRNREEQTAHGKINKSPGPGEHQVCPISVYSLSAPVLAARVDQVLVKENLCKE